MKATDKKKTLEALELAYQEFMAKEDFKQAFEVLQHIEAIHDEIFEVEKKRKLEELMREFHREQQDELLAQEQEHNLSLRAKNAELEEVLNEQKSSKLHLKSLQLQLSPHFIFNTLQGIQSFIFQQDESLIADYIAEFASLMRAILHASQQVEVSVQDEVQLLQTYLSLEKRRFADKFSYQVCYEKVSKPLQVKLPALLIQPFVENAILHGIANQQNGEVLVAFRSGASSLFIHILDNGIGRKAAQKIEKRTHQGTSTALKILRERADLSKKGNRLDFNFKIIDRKDNNRVRGTHVIIQVNF